MSYIRCLSNPEKLYIWGSGKYIDFATNSPDLKSIPSGYFNSFMSAYLKKGNEWRFDDFQWGKLSIKEVFVKHKRKQTKFEKEFGNYKPGNYKYELRYGGKLIVRMWMVTWAYIVNNFRKERA